MHPRLAYGRSLEELLKYSIKINDEVKKLSIAEIYEQNLVEVALSQGLRVDECDHYGLTLLYYACKEADIDMIKYLISLGADQTKRTPLDNGRYSSYPCVGLLFNPEKSCENYDELVKIFAPTINIPSDYNASTFAYLENYYNSCFINIKNADDNRLNKISGTT
jgi:ankyrin repeat protein